MLDGHAGSIGNRCNQVNNNKDNGCITGECFPVLLENVNRLFCLLWFIHSAPIKIINRSQTFIWTKHKTCIKRQQNFLIKYKPLLHILDTYRH